MWLLTDEEIAYVPATNMGGNFDDLRLCKAQLKKIMQLMSKYNGVINKIPEQDWQQLLQECE